MNSRLSFLKFPTIYNNHGATKNIQCPDKPLCFKAFRASFTLGAAGNIRSGNAAEGGYFPLGKRRLIVKAIAQPDDVCFPASKTGIHAPANFGTGIP